MEFCSIQACPLVLSDVGAQVLYDLGQSTLKVGVGDGSRIYKVKQKKMMSSFMGTLVELTSASYTIVESGSGTKRTLPLPLMRATAFVKGVPAPYPPLSISEMTETAFLPEKSRSLPEPPTPLPFQALTRDDFVSEEEWEAYKGANAALRSNGQDVAGEAGEAGEDEAGEDAVGEEGYATDEEAETTLYKPGSTAVVEAAGSDTEHEEEAPPVGVGSLVTVTYENAPKQGRVVLETDEYVHVEFESPHIVWSTRKTNILSIDRRGPPPEAAGALEGDSPSKKPKGKQQASAQVAVRNRDRVQVTDGENRGKYGTAMRKVIMKTGERKWVVRLEDGSLIRVLAGQLRLAPTQGAPEPQEGAVDASPQGEPSAAPAGDSPVSDTDRRFPDLPPPVDVQDAPSAAESPMSDTDRRFLPLPLAPAGSGELPAAQQSSVDEFVRGSKKRQADVRAKRAQEERERIEEEKKRKETEAREAREKKERKRQRQEERKRQRREEPKDEGAFRPPPELGEFENLLQSYPPAMASPPRPQGRGRWESPPDSPEAPNSEHVWRVRERFHLLRKRDALLSESLPATPARNGEAPSPDHPQNDAGEPLPESRRPKDSRGAPVSNLEWQQRLNIERNERLVAQLGLKPVAARDARREPTEAEKQERARLKEQERALAIARGKERSTRPKPQVSYADGGGASRHDPDDDNVEEDEDFEDEEDEEDEDFEDEDEEDDEPRAGRRVRTRKRRAPTGTVKLKRVAGKVPRSGLPTPAELKLEDLPWGHIELPGRMALAYSHSQLPEELRSALVPHIRYISYAGEARYRYVSHHKVRGSFQVQLSFSDMSKASTRIANTTDEGMGAFLAVAALIDPHLRAVESSHKWAMWMIDGGDAPRTWFAHVRRQYEPEADLGDHAANRAFLEALTTVRDHAGRNKGRGAGSRDFNVTEEQEQEMIDYAKSSGITSTHTFAGLQKQFTRVKHQVEREFPRLSRRERAPIVNARLKDKGATLREFLLVFRTGGSQEHAGYELRYDTLRECFKLDEMLAEGAAFPSSYPMDEVWAAETGLSSFPGEAARSELVAPERWMELGVDVSGYVDLEPGSPSASSVASPAASPAAVDNDSLSDSVTDED